MSPLTDRETEAQGAAVEMAGLADGKPALQLRARGVLTQVEPSTWLWLLPHEGTGANPLCVGNRCKIHTAAEGPDSGYSWADLRAGDWPEAAELLWGNCSVCWCARTLDPALAHLCKPNARAGIC